MQHFLSFYVQLEKLESDGEVTAALKEFFAEFGAVGSAGRFFALGESEKRNYLVQFKNSADAIRVTNRYKLRSFGFDGVLIELGGEVGE
jgi:hypothetical protein